MMAFLLAGLILGVLARTISGGISDPQVMLTVPAGVVGAVAGGVVANAVQSEALLDNGLVSFVAACVVSLIVISALEVMMGPRT